MYRDVKKLKLSLKRFLKTLLECFRFMVVAGIIVIVPVVGLILGGPILAGAFLFTLKDN